jgi:hypothetical protein
MHAGDFQRRLLLLLLRSATAPVDLSLFILSQGACLITETAQDPYVLWYLGSVGLYPQIWSIPISNDAVTPLPALKGAFPSYMQFKHPGIQYNWPEESLGDIIE